MQAKTAWGPQVALVIGFAVGLAGCSKKAEPAGSKAPAGAESKAPKTEPGSDEAPAGERRKAGPATPEHPTAAKAPAKTQGTAPTPPAAPAEPLPIEAIDAASLANCALMKDGTVRCWGANIEGQLGVGKTMDELLETYTPLAVEGLTDVEKLWAMASYCWSGSYSEGTTDTMCARKKGGKVLCWGHNDLIFGDGKREKSTKPVEVAALEGIVDIDAHCGTACAVMADRSVKCWGSGVFGQIGDGDKKNRDVPTPVKDLAGAAEVGCGQNHCCARKDDGTVWCWGYNSSGQCGDGTREKRMAPVQVKEVAKATGLAVTTNGACALVEGGTVICWGDGFYKGPAVVEGATDVVAIDGEGLVCGVTKGGTALCWGPNTWGQLGDGTTKDRKSTAAPVKDLQDVAAVRVGDHHACALLTDRVTVRCWGRNGRNQLGDATLADSAVPVTAAHVTDRTLVALAEDKYPSALPADAKTPDVTGMPAACTRDAGITLKRHGRPLIMPVRVAWATRSWDKKGYTVTLANFDLDPARAWPMVRGQQLKVSFSLSYWTLQEEADSDQKKKKLVKKPVEVAKEYTTRHLADYRLSVGLYDRAKQHWVDQGAFKLTHLDDGWLCGTLDLSHKDGKTEIKGNVAVRLLEKK